MEFKCRCGTAFHGVDSNIHQQPILENLQGSHELISLFKMQPILLCAA